jgi:hypothetical protein
VVRIRSGHAPRVARFCGSLAGMGGSVLRWRWRSCRMLTGHPSPPSILSSGLQTSICASSRGSRRRCLRSKTRGAGGLKRPGFRDCSCSDCTLPHRAAGVVSSSGGEPLPGQPRSPFASTEGDLVRPRDTPRCRFRRYSWIGPTLGCQPDVHQTRFVPCDRFGHAVATVRRLTFRKSLDERLDDPCRGHRQALRRYPGARRS